MEKTGQGALVFPDWKEHYRAVRCLKRTADRETWLLESKNDAAYFILKTAWGGQGDFLKTEYEMLMEMLHNTGRAEEGGVEYRETKERAFLIRAYVQGMTVEELAEQEGALTPEETAEIGEKLCKRIAAFHHHNPPIIHRDIKPENIVITGSGKLQLIDFGTARHYKPGQQTDTVRMGTRGYAAPEQFGFGQTDVRTDIYAVGKVLLYLAAGDAGEESMALLQKGDQKRLKRIIRRCCDFNPDRRYQNVEQLQKDLARLKTVSGRNFRIQCALCGTLVLMSAAIALLGASNLRMRRDLQEKNGVKAAKDTATGDTAANGAAYGTASETESGAWDPYEYEEAVAQIGSLALSGDDAGAAKACEELAARLEQNEKIAGVEPVAYWTLSEAETAEYQTGRMGYEYIADRLAYEGGLADRSPEDMEQNSGRIAAAVRASIEYSWTDEDGNSQRSQLYRYLTEGDRSNMDGCIIELLDCMNRGLE